ncbi:MAG: hypothetical protein AAGF92_17760 [Myxococcota bacterium]
MTTSAKEQWFLERARRMYYDAKTERALLDKEEASVILRDIVEEVDPDCARLAAKHLIEAYKASVPSIFEAQSFHRFEVLLDAAIRSGITAFRAEILATTEPPTQDPPAHPDAEHEAAD